MKAVALMLAGALAGLTIVEGAAAQSPSRSERTLGAPLKARDIGGVALGMTKDDLAKVLSLDLVEARPHPDTRTVHGGIYRGAKGGVSYRVTLTRDGRVKRVQTQQTLATARVDRAFWEQFVSDMKLKYGDVRGRGFWYGDNLGHISWEHHQTAQRRSELDYPTKRMEALLVKAKTGFGDPIKIEMELVDDEAERQDRAADLRDAADKVRGSIRF